MAYCKKCGKEAADTARFCPACGGKTTKRKLDKTKMGLVFLLIACGFLVLLCLVLFILLAVMPYITHIESTPAPTAAVTTDPTTEPSTEPLTEPTAPPVPLPAHTRFTDASPDNRPMYLVDVPQPDYPIYSGPGLQYDYVGTVELAGIYTVMQESPAPDGTVWGRLKSGVGWIDVTCLPKDYYSHIALTAAYATGDILQSGNKKVCYADNSEYAFPVVFHIIEDLQDVYFTDLTVTDYGCQITKSYDYLPEITPSSPYVVWVSFPGDMTAYGICFTDAKGQTHYYRISISGYDGSLVLSPLAPA